MEKLFFLQKGFKFVLSFLLLSSSFIMKAQDDVTMKWTAEVGCQALVPTDGDPNKRFEELIENQECLRVCEYSSVTHSLDANYNS